MDTTDSMQQLAAHLGLKPYEEFERFITPFARRLTPSDRKNVLEKVYALMVEKVIRESDKKEFTSKEQVFAEQWKSIHSTRAHINRAIEELLAAEGSLHQDLPKWIDVKPIIAMLEEFDTELLDNENRLKRLECVMADPTGKAVEHINSESTMIYLIPLIQPTSVANTYVFPGKRTTATDYPFISAVNDCLPKALPGKRSRIGHDEFIQKVFEFINERCSRSRITIARKRIRKATEV
jgi:hypothetical protein